MLKPTKHTDPARSTLAVAADLLSYLRRYRTASFVDVRGYIKKHRPETLRLFVDATSLLFLLGLVEYRRKTDALEYVGPK